MSSAQLGGHAASSLQQPASHTGAHGSQPQRSGLGADPAQAEPTRRKTRKWTANQEKTMTNKYARDDRASVLRKLENNDARGKNKAPR